MARRSRDRALTPKARAFADAYAGPGTGAGAARAAGYAGSDNTLKVTAAQQIKDPRVIDRIIKRVGAEQWGAWFATVPEREPAPPRPPKPTGPLVKGKGRGTSTERIELAMGMGRDKKLEPKERLAALRLAAELEGELRSGGAGRRVILPPTSSPVAPPPAPNEPASPAPPKVRAPGKATGEGGMVLYLNSRDAELA